MTFYVMQVVQVDRYYFEVMADWNEYVEAFARATSRGSTVAWVVGTIPAVDLRNAVARLHKSSCYEHMRRQLDGLTYDKFVEINAVWERAR